MSVPFDLAEARRYLGQKVPDERIDSLLIDCYHELSGRISPAVTHRVFPLDPGRCPVDLNALLVGKDIKAHLAGCFAFCLMAATLGPGPDRLIARYSKTDMLRAAALQAAAAAMIEAVCDEFCDGLAKETAPDYITGRFSPGYGDMPLSCQPYINRILDAPKKIGLTVTESCMLAPSKSVTAFIGISNTPKRRCYGSCMLCGKADCPFRSTH